MIFFLLVSNLLFCSPVFGSPGFHEPWGKDSEIRCRQFQQPEICKTRSPMAWVAEKLIRFHQTVISPVDGPRSHFRPSSSGYMLEAIHIHGFLKGYFIGCDRLLRENSEKWVYPTIEYEGHTLKWDPPPQKFP